MAKVQFAKFARAACSKATLQTCKAEFATANIIKAQCAEDSIATKHLLKLNGIKPNLLKPNTRKLDMPELMQTCES